MKKRDSPLIVFFRECRNCLLYPESFFWFFSNEKPRHGLLATIVPARPMGDRSLAWCLKVTIDGGLGVLATEKNALLKVLHAIFAVPSTGKS
jgi:hypothetical protein